MHSKKMNNKDIQLLNSASLISLKAELSRKRTEGNASSIRGKPSRLIIKNQESKNVPNGKKRQKKSAVQHSDLSVEENELINSAKAVLTSKSQLYDKLCQNHELANGEKNNFLVNFEEKQNLALPENNDNPVEDYQDSDDEWVEYTDSFGRTKRCLRDDLEYNKKKLEDIVVKKVEVQEEIVTPSPELQSWDMRREELRKKWEQEEIALTQKTDTHYQDVLFDEARVHGTGYFQFSKDEEERRRQQESLLKMRQETEEQQKKMEAIKQRRDDLMKSRVGAAKRRKRIRLGLSPEEDEQDSLTADPNITSTDHSNSEVDQNSELEKQKEMEAFSERVKENLEKIRRAAHIRPWDIGKDGTTQPVMTQEEWVENQRSKRIKEFAPPSEFSKSNEISSKNNILEHNSENFVKIVEPDFSNTDFSLIRQKTNFFTSKKNKILTNKQKFGSPINSDDSDCEPSKKMENILNKGVNIPPPLSYDENIKNNPKLANQDIKSSIEAGFNFIKQHEEIDQNKRERGFLE